MGTKTIQDIADAAKVSKATVSRVINGTAPVNEKTKQRVLKIIEKFNFQPNASARQLAGGKNPSIALVMEESVDQFFSNPFWKSVVHGFITQATEFKRHPILFVQPKDEKETELIDTLKGANFQSVAVFGWHRDIQNLEKLAPKNMQIVFGGRQGESKRFTYIGVDNVLGGEMATNHLIDVGCKNILIITGDLSVVSAQERLTGYKKALAKAKIKFDQKNVLIGDYTQLSASKAMQERIQKKVNFDGIFACSDLMAFGAIAELKKIGVRVPAEVKVIGFDDSELAQLHSPALTTIAQPAFLLGKKVALQLISAEAARVGNIVLPLELVVRESTKVVATRR